MGTVALPQFTGSIDTRYFLEPLNATTHPANYLSRFPNALYNKSQDSHFLRFMYALLGPVGVGWLLQATLDLRLQLEASGADLDNLDSLYSDPFAFARIASEITDLDTTGLLSSSQWNAIRAQDESFRTRAIEFLNAARLGCSPPGMQLAASSGLGQNCELFENYKFLFDYHSDDRLGLPYYGQSANLGEFIIVPRPEVSRTEQQTIAFDQASVPLGSNTFTITFNGYTTSSFTTATLAPTVQIALEALNTIGAGNVAVTGGPAPAPFVITFTGLLSNQALPTLAATFNAGTLGIISIPVTVATGAVDPTTETVAIADVDRHNMQVALDELRPVASYPTFYQAQGTLRPQAWNTVTPTTESSQVVRFVTGSPSIPWPATDSLHWIEPATEVEAPQTQDGTSQHYVNFHNVSTVTAYTDAALADPNYTNTTAILGQYNSVHIGPFPEMVGLFPFFSQFGTQYSNLFSASDALAPEVEPLVVTAQTDAGIAVINDVYPADYMGLQGVPDITSNDGDFWASLERASGAEILEIDLGTPQAVNYVAMEVTRKPVTISVAYDLLDQSPARTFAPIVPISGFPDYSTLYYDPSQQNPWEEVFFYFNDGLGMIFTRFIRLSFLRRADSTISGRFLYNTTTQTQTPWSIDVRNLRIGRNIAPSID